MTTTADEVEVKESPILFSGAMICAILEGRKTQTRRVITNERAKIFAPGYADDRERILGLCPYGRVADRLWVRETWRTEELEAHLVDGIRFRADNAFVRIADTQQASEDWVVANDGHYMKWRPSIFMPRWASRITLEITNVRVERVQEISEADAIAEGVRTLRDGSGTYAGREGPGNLVTPWATAKEAFADGWDSINGKRKGCKWADNPFVWVVEFKKL